MRERIMNRERLATELLCLAKELASCNVTSAKSSGKSLEDNIKAASVLANEFKQMHSSLIKEFEAQQAKVKETEEMIKGYYKDWAKKSGYAVIQKEILGQAATSMAIGETLEGIAEDIKVLRRDSKQESYKPKFEILMGMLNERELAKYSRLLNSYFAKQVTELKVGFETLDGTARDWYQEAKDIADERNYKLPRASVATSGTHSAGIIDVLKKVIPSLVKAVSSWAKGLYSRVVRNGQDLLDIQRDITVLAVKIKKVTR
jgi:hypothetical protein